MGDGQRPRLASDVMPHRANAREPVCIEELCLPVPIPDFSPWVFSLGARYQDDERLRKHFLEKRGLSNDIQKELIPLAKFCEKVASQRPTERLRYVHGSRQSFDAEILMPDGQASETLEVTLACDGYQEALANEALAKHGYAPLWSTIEYSGSRADRVIPMPDLKSLDAEKIVGECIEQVCRAVAKKSDSGKYDNINLVVAFNDFRLLSQEHHSMASQAFASITSRFRSIYFVGLCGQFFMRSEAEA
jgi:hypothetical protein